MDNIAHERHDLALRELPFILNKCAPKCFDSSTFLSVNWHENIELIYVTDGSGKISCDFVEYPVKKGELFAINSDVFHGFSADSDSVNFEYYYLIVGRDFCRDNGFDTDTVKLCENIVDSVAADLFEKIVEAYELKGEYRGLAVRAAVLNLLYRLCTFHINKGTDAKKKKKGSNTDNIRAAIVYIRENLSGRLTTKELARASGISEYYFIREFKRITHYTPVTYINIVRCDTARKLLYEGNKNVGEVANLCGFENMPYFTKTFKKYTGILPSDVKREKKKIKK
ncbi:MAG: AraC family transcriptional regulator [Ruminococcaceae bacterium]|nr:AraC family transcriptional regulator [Oscillospiraceae bacterium]